MGVVKIGRAARPLVDVCREGLTELPVEQLTPVDPESMAVIVASRNPHADQLQTHLRANGVHVMWQAGRVHVALHSYNTQADVEKFLGTLRDALNRVGGPYAAGLAILDRFQRRFMDGAGVAVEEHEDFTKVPEGEKMTLLPATSM